MWHRDISPLFFLAHQAAFLYNASMATVLAVIIALFFFLCGCVKLGSFIARTSMGEIPEYLDSLMLQAWPLAIAAILFVLIDIRLQRSAVGVASDDETDIPESSFANKSVISTNSTTNTQLNKDSSYFHIDGNELPPSRPAEADVPSPKPEKSQASSPFATPPPFEKKASTPPPAPKPEAEPPKKDDSDLSFFKL